MSTSHIWPEHTHTLETIRRLNVRVSYYPDMWACDVALSLLWFLSCRSLFLFLWALFRYLSYGVYRAWSIWTMPAILRIFVYQTDASLFVLGQCGSYDQGASRSGHKQSATLCRADLIGISYTASSLWRTMLWSQWGIGRCSLLASCLYVFGVRR